LLTIEPNRVGVAADFDLVGIPLSRHQGRAPLIVLLAGIPADGHSVNCTRAVFVESIRIPSREFVNLDFKAGIDCYECLIVVGMGDSRKVTVGHRESWIAESNQDAGVVVDAAQLELQFQRKVAKSLCG